MAWQCCINPTGGFSVRVLGLQLGSLQLRAWYSKVLLWIAFGLVFCQLDWMTIIWPWTPLLDFTHWLKTCGKCLFYYGNLQLGLACILHLSKLVISLELFPISVLFLIRCSLLGLLHTEFGYLCVWWLETPDWVISFNGLLLYGIRPYISLHLYIYGFE